MVLKVLPVLVVAFLPITTGFSSLPSQIDGSTEAATSLVAALRSITHIFLKYKTTAPADCDILSGGTACWEECQEYFWPDMVDAVEKMATRGVAGRTFYAGTSSNGYVPGLANIAAFLAQTMQETIQYDACDENNWSNADAVAMVVNAGGTGGEVYPATAACGQLGQSYQDYKCSDALDPETGAPIPPEDLECGVDLDMAVVARTSAQELGDRGAVVQWYSSRRRS
jgi:hypothetical protein